MANLRGRAMLEKKKFVKNAKVQGIYNLDNEHKHLFLYKFYFYIFLFIFNSIGILFLKTIKNQNIFKILLIIIKIFYNF